MNFLQQSVAYSRKFFLTSASDHLSPSTGRSPTVQISKGPGGAFGSAAGAVTEIGSGWYQVALTTTDTNTAGDLAYHITATGSDSTDFVDRVVPGAVHPAGVTVATGGITASSFGAGAINAAAIASDAIDTAKVSAGAVNKIADGLLDRSSGVESGLTPRQALRVALAALAGKLSGAATTTVTVRNIGDSLDRIVATVDADGNRSAVTLNLA